MIVIIADDKKEPVLFVKVHFRDNSADVGQDFKDWGLTPELSHAIHFGSKEFADDLLGYVQIDYPNAYCKDV